MLESRYDQVMAKSGATWWSALCARSGPDLALLWEGGVSERRRAAACLSAGLSRQRDWIMASNAQTLHGHCQCQLSPDMDKS